MQIVMLLNGEWWLELGWQSFDGQGACAVVVTVILEGHNQKGHETVTA